MEVCEQIRPGSLPVGRLLCVLGAPVDKGDERRLVSSVLPSPGKLQRDGSALIGILADGGIRRIVWQR